MTEASIETVYPLSPTQEGMLFHTLYDRESRVYFEQITTSFRGPVDVPCFKRAWQRVVDRHAILRTLFVWEGQKKPLQVVRRRVALAWREEDWRGRSAAEQGEALDSFLRADRDRGFEITKAPPMRLSLVRIADEEYHFVWSFHHALLDGWSVAILNQEVLSCYEAFVRGTEPDLPPVHPYRSYIQWLQKQSPGKAEAFWRQQLAGFTTPTRLEPSGSDGLSAGFREECFELPEAMSGALQAFARQHRLTLSTVFQAVWALLLSRHAGEDDVLFGAAFSGRPPELPGIESMVGLFLGTLPVRVEVRSKEPFLRWVKGLQEVQFEIQQHQHVPLVELQALSGVPRGVPLFESLVVFENYPVDQASGHSPHGIAVTGFRLWAHTNYPLHLKVSPGARFYVSLIYDASRYDPPTMRSLLLQVPTVLEQVLARPESLLHQLSLATPDSRAVLPDPSVVLAEEEFAPVTALFEGWARRSPQEPALIQGGRSLSYEELAERAHAVAWTLRSRGLEAGEVVALDGQPGFGLIGSLLGILFAGGVALIADRKLPAERRRLMCREAGANWLVRLRKEGAAEERWAEPDLRESVAVDLASGRVMEPSADFATVALPELDDESGAYVFFTSGTTGVPKGVLGTHRGLSHFVAWQRATFGVGPGDRSSHLTGLSFDVVLREIFLPLTSGATLCLPEEAEELGAERVLPWLERQRITVLHTVPTLAETWLLDPPRGVSLKSLRLVFFAGEPLGGRLVKQWRETFEASATIVNLYGPTETTLAKCFYVVPPEPGDGVQPVGRSLPQSQALVLAEGGHRCGVGEWGEIVIRTPYRTRGYVNAPDENRRRFRPNPARSDDRDLLYHTGDRGRFRADGVLEISGRLDDQIKVRGARVEPGEIAGILGQHPAVRQSVVLGQKGEEGGARLVAYVVPEKGTPLTADDLKGSLKAKLPDYMVPSAFVFLEALPLTANGKLDRRALPVPEAPATKEAAIPVAPRAPIEEELAAIWREVLRVETVGAHDDFFQLGGHSLLATQVMSRIRGALGVELPIRSIYESPTIAGLATVVGECLRGGGGAPQPPLVQVGRSEHLPLSFAQQRLWFLDQMVPDTPAYNIPGALRLEGELEVAALERALAEIVRRHEVLRSTVGVVAGRPVLRVDPSGSFVLATLDLRELPESQRDEEALRLAGEEARRPFDLVAGPLFRSTLIRVREREHVLLVTLHHIVSDAWSLGVLVHELGVLYAAYAAGRPSPLPDLAVQYADFAEWQRQWLQGEVLESQLSYWRGRLAGPRPVLDLPTDHPRPAVQSFRGAHHTLPLPRELAEELRALSRREGSTLFMTLLATFGVLLQRYTGQDDILVGIPVAGRNRTETEGLIGLFVNTLVMRMDLSGSPSFRTLLERVRETALGAYAHSDLPFEKIVEELQPERELSRNPIFQTMLVLQNAPLPALRLPGLALSPLHVPRQTARFDLTLSVLESADGLLGVIEYSADLFEPATIERMAGHWRKLLEEAASAPDRRISELPLLGEREERSVRTLAAGAERAYPSETPVHERVAGLADERPDAAAVVCGPERVTYAELNRRANQLAHHLRGLGVGPEVRVGICLERSVEMVVGLLAILKSGGAYLPLDPSYPPERLAFMLDDAGVPVFVTQERLRPALPGTRSRVVCLDADRAAIAREPDTNPGVQVTGRNLAYVIYTSGSTGRPKGVGVEHGGLSNLTAWHRRAYGVEGADRATLLASLSFDASVWELWPYLTGGASVHVPPDEEVRTSAPRLLEWLQSSRISLSFLATPLAEAVLREPLPEGLALRALLTGGDTLRQRPSSGLPFKLFNHYGPTEGTVVSTWTEVKSEGEEEGAPSIGRPVDNTNAYVLDERLHLVPAGLPGELYVGGAGLARGYLNRPDLTAERFVPDPLGTEPGGRLYRTGDVVRYRSNGNLEFLGRRDEQVKIRGFRIELGEIVSALSRHPGVQDAVVVAREDRPGEKRLVAYVVARPEGGVTTAELQRSLQASLPAYMLPSALVFLDALPLSPNGKVDRRALPAPDGQADADLVLEIPRSPIEEALVEIWRDVLGMERVGIHADFFALGGHSLLATRVMSQVRKTYEVELPLRALFEAPTIAALAQKVEAARGSRESVSGPSIRPVPREEGLPLSFAQQRLWFLDQMGAGVAYNIALALRLDGALDVGALQGSLNAIVRRHEALRTTFPAVEGRAVQVVAPSLEVALAEVDLIGLSEAERESEARRLAGEEALRPFDLSGGPLLRAKLLRLGESDQVLLVTIHHIVADGWSMGVLTRELAAHYRAGLEGNAASLRELPVQYADFAHWQREWLRGKELERQLGYWRERLGEDLPRLQLPTDRPRPAVQTYRGANRYVVFPATLAERLTKLCREEGATLFMVLLAGFKALLHRYTGQADLAVGSPIANRNRVETEDLIGFFVNSLVLRTDLSGDPSFRELVRRVKETALGAYDHQDLSFEKLVEELQPERDLSQNPLFQVIFAVQNAPSGPLELPGLTLSRFDRDQVSTRFDLEIHVWEQKGSLAAVFCYNADLFDASTVDRMGRHWLTQLEAAVARPESRLSALPLLGSEERREVLSLARGVRAAYPRDSTVHEEFAVQAARTPEAVAVLFEGEQLSYGELNRRANQLAHHLGRAGVGPGVRVAICVERSLDLVVGLLGILKAGGAYVPLDPEYPQERLAFMLQDARAAVLLTKEPLLESLPSTEARVLCLDRDAGALLKEAVGEPRSGATAEDLAYVTYTSGSTGWPKGVEVEHRGVLRLVLGADYAALSSEQTLLQLAPVSFDASTLEIWGALLVGGRCVVYPERVPTARELGDVLSRQGVTTLWLTASLFNVVVDEAPEALSPVRQLLIGGEALSVGHVRKAQERLPRTRIINGYGPTESTTFTCCHPIPSPLAEGVRSVPIGRPIANTDVYVLDEGLEPVPVGVPGELFIGGDGLARGYLGRPDLTAEKFVPSPFAGGPGERLYRTGDLVKWLGDGTIEFLGRTDDQVKIRGFRIELGEVQSALSRHPAVREAVVVVREGAAPGDKRLVAYIVPAAGGEGVQARGSDVRVAQWREVYDSVIYDQVEAAAPADPTFNLAGWNSTYTGLPIPEEEMREQVDQTVERILAGRPRRVLEIGCGTGLLLFRVAPHCTRYVGTDFSTAALEYLRGRCEALPGPLPQLELWQRWADDFSDVEPGSFDAVVLNSVVQYFPDVDYLVKVLEEAIKALAPGGRLFVGDVRHLPLLEAFASSVQLHQAPPGTPNGQLRERVREQIAQEQELLVDPAFFPAFARHLGTVRRVHVSPKRGRAINELTKYRYDAVLEVGSALEEQSVAWLDWDEDTLSPSRLREFLAEAGPDALGIRQVPNARTRADVLAAKWLARHDEGAPENDDGQGLDPEEVWALAAGLPYEVDLSLAASHAEGRYDVLFRRRTLEELSLPLFPPAEPAPRPWTAYTNDPLQATRVRGLVPQLRRFLQEQLPEYMVPSAFALLESLPLTLNGKVDTRALLAHELVGGEAEEAFEGPRTPIEEELARIWSQVLGTPRVGVRDNFFELGGDSILSIQIIARANQAGLRLTPKQIFQHQTIAELAQMVGMAEAVEAEQGLVLGPVPLTPIQQWFFEQELEDGHHFNQAVLLEVKGDLEAGVLEEAVRVLEEHHDALRLRFERGPLGWRQEVASPGGDAFSRIDLSWAAVGEETAAVEGTAAELQKSLNFVRGPLWRAALLELGGGRGSRLLITIHHLAVDGVSWRVLLDDLDTACAQLARGERVRFPRKTTSFRRWAEKLREYAESEELAGERDYWRAVCGAQEHPPPLDGPRGENTAGSTGVVGTVLGAEETRALLQDVPGVYHTQITDVLLAALARSFARWTGRGGLLLELEGHGREELFAGVDLSRTLGWFTSIFPMRLELEHGAGPGDALKSVKEQLRAIPRRGVGYGLLRYLARDERLQTFPGADVAFNYLGQFDQTIGALALFAPAREGVGASRSPRAKRRHRLEVNALVSAGSLTVTWIYGEGDYRRSGIETLARGFEEELRAVLAHCRTPEAGGHTPSDFPLARVDQRTLDRILAGDRNAEDVYPLSPMQEGMLFHSLLEPESGVYFEQVGFELRGPLHAPSLARAWQHLVDRHPVLRTRFAWDGLPRPLQIVQRRATLSWEEHDWRGTPAVEQRERIDALLAADRNRGLDLSRCPLMRMSLVRTAEETHWLVWSFHHIVLDGWCLSLVLKDVAAAYEAFRHGRWPDLPPVRLYRDHIAWLQEQDMDQAEEFWRGSLRGFAAPTPLPLDRAPARVDQTGAEINTHVFHLSSSATAGLKALGRQHQLTLNTIVQGAWALLLSRWSGESDVVFGVSVSGRPAVLPGVESMVGLFVNTLPLRVQVLGSESLLPWLKRLQAQQIEQRQYEYSPLVRVQGWSEVPAGRPLFESILGFENYPVDASVRPLATLGEVLYRGRTSYPLSIIVGPGPRLSLRIGYDRRRLDSQAVSRIVAHLTTLLEAIAAQPEACLFDLPLLSGAERRQILVEWNATAAGDPQKVLVHERFEQQAARMPDAPALVFGEERLTYAELAQRSNQVANRLRGLGVGPEVQVGICVERSAEMVVGLLGILKAGAAYLPLDPNYPRDRLAFMLADSGVGVLLTQERLLSKLPPHGARVVCLDRDWPEIAEESGEFSASGVGADNLAYVIYTSGSTGRPKGVQVTHCGLGNLAEAETRVFGVHPGSRVLQFASLSFDASIFEIVMALGAGACLCVGTREALLPGVSLLRELRERKVSIVTLPPSALAALPVEELPALEVVTVAGENCPAELVKRWGKGRRFYNLYGPTEATVWSTYALCADGDVAPPIGGPIRNTRVYVLDTRLQPVPVGAPGELHIGGLGLARGYLNRPDLTAERFVPDPFAEEPGGRLYRTGDLVKYRSDGALEFLGRQDTQVKVRGFRIELGEIEAVLGRHPGVRDTVVLLREDVPGDKRLVAYFVPREESPASVAALRTYVLERLPDHMAPAAFVLLERFPLTPNGKVDRRALPAPEGRPDLAERYVAPRSGIEQKIAAVWQDVLKLEKVGARDNFFDLGGHSLHLLQVHGRLRGEFDGDVSVMDLFRYPTIQAIAERLSEGDREVSALRRVKERQEKRKGAREEAVAIVGMAGRFPGAPSLEEFWRNLREGVESITFFTDAELEAAGVPPAVLGDRSYVKARGVLEGVELFDAGFFGYNPREAEVIDPQQRVFLETAWEALERAGYDAEKYPGAIGVYAGVGLNTYLSPLAPRPEVLASVGGFGAVMGSDKDFLPTRVSYKLNLKGPSVAVQTACSTSLVAVHLACRSLLDHECDMALAGGVAIAPPQKTVYRYLEEGILSPDGHCRAFDALARGTVPGAGVGIVVLKRLEDARRDGDAIEAVIKGSAINNDGSNKVGYTAPGVEGQAEVIALAQARAGVEPETIGYVEAHGTGTALGDPIEVEALGHVFGAAAKRGFCAIGSVKTNVGHLDAAAGVAGLIKTALSLKHREIPPSLHFEEPNPKIDFARSPFYVNRHLRPWEANGAPRRAGVSSFGIGGTNAHVVVEEAPAPGTTGPSRPWQLLVWSARNAPALEEATTRLAEHLEANPSLELADVSYTLQLGRREFAQRRAAVCRDAEDARRVLAGGDPRRVLQGVASPRAEGVVFLFPGQGAQHPRMCEELYREERVFRGEVDRCAELLREELGLDLREVLYPLAGTEGAAARLGETWLTQPALFVVEWALAQLWLDWGVKASGMLGHSIGEYVAACLSGVMSLEDALRLVAARGRLMRALPGGAMTAVELSEPELEGLRGPEVALAAVNGPAQCVVSGPVTAVEELERRLSSRGLEYRRLATSHAFHSGMMDPVLEPFLERLSRVELKPPRIPYVSNLTGRWIRRDEATDPRYWVRHLRETVRFSDGLGELLAEPRQALLEVGPGQTLSGLVRRQPRCGPDRIVLSSSRHARGDRSDEEALLTALGGLWLAGVDVDWAAHRAGERRRRVPLPTYPFQRQRYWLGRDGAALAATTVPAVRKDSGDWFYLPSWKRSRPLAEMQLPDRPRGSWLVFADDCGLGARLARRLADRGQDVVTVQAGEGYLRADADRYQIDPAAPDHYESLVGDLCGQGRAPRQVLHLWGVTPRDRTASLERSQDLGFYSLVFLAQSLGNNGVDQLGMAVVTSQMQEVSGEGPPHPEKATVLGPCKVIPCEYRGITCRSIDVLVPASGSWSEAEAQRLLAECALTTAEPVVALRGIDRWVQTFEPVRLEQEGDPPSRLRRGGVYLVTGGLGGIGLELAEYLARSVQARLVLVGRSGLPPRPEWDAWLARDSEADATTRRLRKVRSLESLGAEVVIERADVCQRTEMEEVLRRAEERFGRVHGVVHAAGIVPGGVIQLKTRETAEAVMAAKVKGTLVLCELLRERQPDFLVLCSSLASVLGQPGQVDYAAANAFLDAVARRNTAGGGPFTVSINWDTWSEVGMSVDTTVRPELAEALRRSLQNGIHPKEGREAFGRILSQCLPEVLTSVVDLAPRLSRAMTAEPPSAPNLALAGESPSAGASLHPRPAQETPYAEPSTEVECTLAEVWQNLLGIDRIGVHDNFFELGGDSLTALKAVGLLRGRLGRDIRIVTFYEAPTISLLAQALADQASDKQVALEGVEQRADTRLELMQRRRARAGAAGSPLGAQQVSRSSTTGDLAPVGPVPLTPIQHWFFEQRLADPHHFNQSALLEVRRPLDPALLELAIGEVIRRHDALRLRYTPRNGQVVAELCEGPASPLTRVDQSDLSEAEQGLALQASASEFHRSLSPVEGRLVRAVCFDRGEGRSARLLLVVHHLAVDAISWPILLEDLETACRQLSAGQALRLPPRSSSFADWARALARFSRSESVGREAEYWLALPWHRVRPLPVDRTGGSNTVASVRIVSSTLDSEHTHALLRELPGRFKAKVDEILLAALAAAMQRWTGGGALLVDLEAHGREAVVEGVDVSRTVGWFTSLVPVLLEVEPGTGLVQTLRSAKEQFRAIPGRGLGYGLLRYLRGDEGLARTLGALPQSEVSFLYLGRFDPAAAVGLFGAAPEPAGEVRSPRALRRHLLEVVASVTGGHLRVVWMYSEDLHHRSTVEALAESYLAMLRALVLASREHETHTAAAFPAAAQGEKHQRRAPDAFIE
jgi:amino acid adenylation domain-containing protein/non-ribosomal peptide synthase protein (TIGR01720 family)